jgi:hypothetical protein
MEACTIMSCRACTNYPRVISAVTVGLYCRLSDAPGSLDLIAMVTTSGDCLSGVSRLKLPSGPLNSPLEATELGAKSGNSLWRMPPYSESGRILLAEGSFGSRLCTKACTKNGCSALSVMTCNLNIFFCPGDQQVEAD